jgi:hypothetical protein
VIENSQQDEKSRSQVKRDFRELKDLGIRLAGLSKGQLRAIPLSEKTREALQATQGMARNARQRHYRYLSSLLAEEDVAAVRTALAGALQPHVEDVADLHEAEQWRDKLLSADERQLAEERGLHGVPAQRPHAPQPVDPVHYLLFDPLASVRLGRGVPVEGPVEGPVERIGASRRLAGIEGDPR